MDPCRHLKEVFYPLDIEIMEQALHAALQTVKAHHVIDALVKTN